MVTLNSPGALLALAVLVICLVAIALALMSSAATLPAWLAFVLIGGCAASRLC